MNVVFLIGNGFDINCGLKSRYTDMYEGYCSSNSRNAVLGRFKREIKRNIALWSDFEKEIAKYASTVDNEDELLECVRDFKKYLSEHLENENNTFINYLKNMPNHQLVVREFLDSFESFYNDCGFKMSFVRKMNHQN